MAHDDPTPSTSAVGENYARSVIESELLEDLLSETRKDMHSRHVLARAEFSRLADDPSVVALRTTNTMKQRVLDMIRRKARYIVGMAASIVLASTFWFQSNSNNPAVAFAEVIEMVNNTRMVKYTFQSVQQGNERFDLTWTIYETDDGRYRCDFPKQNFIEKVWGDNLDYKGMHIVNDGEFEVCYQKPIVRLSSVRAAKHEFQEYPPRGAFLLLSQFRSGQLVFQEDLGVRVIDGKEARGFKATSPDEPPIFDRTLEIWVDAVEKFPLSVHSRFLIDYSRTGPEQLRTLYEQKKEILDELVEKGDLRANEASLLMANFSSGSVTIHENTLSDFKWDTVIDPSLFEIVLPPNWKIDDPTGIERQLRNKNGKP